MTVTYDPDHPQYYDDGDLRGELTRVFDLCHGCRLCFNLCPSFPTLFGAIDGRDGDVGALTRPEQDQVVDECYQCKLCYVKCPYVPPHEWELDFPRLMLRAAAVRRGERGRRAKLADQVLGRTDAMGRVNTALAPLVNAATQRPGSPVRRAMDRVLGIASERLLPPYARQRFSSWFRRRPASPVPEPQARVSLFPTCFVEYNAPAVGHDLVKVYEHNRVECQLPEGLGCCGAPWLHAGDFEQFRRTARRNVGILADEIRQGRDIVVAQPTCGYVLKRDYLEYLRGPDAALVAEHTYDACEFLIDLHRNEGTQLDTDFRGDVPPAVTYHAPCHLQAQNVGLRSRDLLKLTGTKVTLVNKCSGIDGTWGLRSDNYALARKVARPLAEGIEAADASAPGAVVAGDCLLANNAITQETGAVPLHPLQVVARAYGLTAEPDSRIGPR